MADGGVEYRCFVGGLAWATDDRNLEQAFSQFGEILDAKVSNHSLPDPPQIRSNSLLFIYASARSACFPCRI